MPSASRDSNQPAPQIRAVNRWFPMPTTYDESMFSARPAVLDAIRADTAAIGFNMSSTPRNGAMLCALAATKPSGRLLELGTGTGIATAWLLHGMTSDATLDTADNDPACVAVARRHLGTDPRVRFHVTDGGEFLRAAGEARYDLVFADTWPGKFTDLDAALSLLRPGGLYVIDDLLPQANWPADHAPKIPRLMHDLASRPDLVLWPLEWDSGVAVAVKRA